MLQHNKTLNKFYEDGVEITQSEYEAKYQAWKDNLPPPPIPDPNPPIDEYEAVEILLGGSL